MTKERPQQNPPIEATAFSMFALIRSMSSICTHDQSPHDYYILFYYIITSLILQIQSFLYLMLVYSHWPQSVLWLLCRVLLVHQKTCSPPERCALCTCTSVSPGGHTRAINAQQKRNTYKYESFWKDCYTIYLLYYISCHCNLFSYWFCGPVHATLWSP